jgi:PEP-CTERM motif
MNIYARTIAVGLCATLFASTALAADFTGYSRDITDFANGSEVSTRGTLIDAVNLLNDNVGGVGVTTTINGVLFKGTAPGQFHEAGESFAEASFVYHGGDAFADGGLWSSDGAYDTLADSQIYNIDNPSVNAGDGFGVVNLTPGTFYQLQVFMLDDRSGISKTFPIQFQQVLWAGSADNIDNSLPAGEFGFISGVTIGGNGVTQANGEIATATFTIDAGYNGILVNSWDNGAYNGMQLRALGPQGDYNGNNSVGPEDYDVWRANFGSTTNLAADGNFDGTVDAADYIIWRDRTSSASGGGSALNSANVPEPSTIVVGLAALALFGSIFSRRLRSRRN